MQRLLKPGAKRKASPDDPPLGEASQSAPDPLPAPPSKKRMLSTAGEGVKTALKLLKECFDSVPVPGIKAAVGGILELIRIFENVTENQDELVQLATRINALKTHIEQSSGHFAQGFLPQPLQSNAAGLVIALNDMAKDAERAFGKSRANRIANHDAYKAMIQALNTKLDRTIESISMDTCRRIESRLEDGFTQGQAWEFDRLIETRRAPLAAYNAPRTAGTLSRCSEGTRVPLLQSVTDWRKDPDADRVFWLKERAGFGKTAIALSVARQAANEGTLAASFFFSYQIPDLSNTLRFLPTIIYQLCLFGGAPYKQHFAAAIAKHPGLLDAKLKDQAQKLFLDPLKNLDLTPVDAPIVVVIDALDECQHEDAEDLTVFIASLSLLNLPLKIFITSRPESQITAPFSDLGVESRAIVDTSNEDVETYLRAELAKIPSKPSIRSLDLPRDWIKEDDIQALLERAGAKGRNSDSTSGEKGLFVYIATVVRFIGDTRRCDPAKLLEIVLSATPALSAYRPFQVLDDLYIRVVDMALEGADDLLQRFHAVVGGLLGLEDNGGVTITGLEQLLDLPQGEVRRTLVNLQSVIEYPDANSTLPGFHHRSFTDFLTSKDRSGPRYYIDLKPHQKRLALACLRVIATSPLKQEVVKAMNKEDYFCYFAANVSPLFPHASLYLPNYFEHNNGDADLLEDLNKFIRDDFGWWIELLPNLYGAYARDYYLIPDAVDTGDELELPVLLRALPSSDGFHVVDLETHATALLRKELRRYISAVTQQQDSQSRIRTQALTTSIKSHIHELRKRIPDDDDDDQMETCLAILTFSKEVEAVVDNYLLSVGNEKEVERSRKRTIFLRRQVKPLLVERGWITEDEPFEQQGMWTPSVDSRKRVDSDSDSDSDSDNISE